MIFYIFKHSAEVGLDDVVEVFLEMNSVFEDKTIYYEDKFFNIFLFYFIFVLTYCINKKNDRSYEKN